MLFRIQITILVLVALLVASCIDSFDKKYEFNTNLIKIDGFLTDQDPFFITVVQSRSTQGTEFSQPVRGAAAELIVSDNTRIALRESGLTQGRYEAPASFRGRVGLAYRLRVRFTDGRVYESSLEKIVAVPPIRKVYTDFNQEGIKDIAGNSLVSTIDVSVDFQDNAQETNFYQWRTFLFEQQRICGSCVNGDWNAANNDCEGYRTNDVIIPIIINDYSCDRPCWEVFSDAKLNLFSDALTNGGVVSKKLLRQVPFYVENGGALLQIQQISISPAVYRHLNIIRQQSETKGSITDVAPAPPVGNIRNVNNPEEPVLGYFAATSITKTTIWIERNQPSARRITMLPGGRPPSPDQDSKDPFTRLPKPFRINCLASPNRFIAPPDGWRF
ncbi:DUF4249 domain-containing protein [Runella slithyformis]|uniref:DUF4249 domain-containing protein n=1 Tax=Runella slithyformis (strain ATCC 29530 / DSM 19594 / LMG 11500 / NCIMB 11436 / LSU 4) TaxID=761193 RepID=A0A7U3ZNN6_RUNSL|nr:DUF4249 domain-containing protein [Runella slithyformis]AEI50551.1 hypothetical protein Runsl_4207 [Runella slithyformis DSM 19594]